jgi:hypothetical protein
MVSIAKMRLFIALVAILFLLAIVRAKHWKGLNGIASIVIGVAAAGPLVQTS